MSLYFIRYPQKNQEICRTSPIFLTVPSLPGCVTYGAAIEEAINMAKEAIELYIESLKAHGEEIPTEDGVLEYTLTIKANA